MGNKGSTDSQQVSGGDNVEEVKKEFDFDIPLAKQFEKNDVQVHRKKLCSFMPDPKPRPPGVNITYLLSGKMPVSFLFCFSSFFFWTSHYCWAECDLTFS